MARRSNIEVAASAAAIEREAVVDYIRERMASAVRLASRGRLPRDEADTLNSSLDAIADGISKGLHR